MIRDIPQEFLFERTMNSSAPSLRIYFYKGHQCHKHYYETNEFSWKIRYRAFIELFWLCSLLLVPHSLCYTAIGNCNRTEYNFCFVFCWYGTSRMTKYLRSLVLIPLVSSTLYCSLLTERLQKRAICLINHSPMVSLHKLDQT